MKHLILFFTFFVLFNTQAFAKTHYKKHAQQHVKANKTVTAKHTTKVKNHALTGIASWYGYESGPHYRRRPRTANGEYFTPYGLTAAHKTLPFGTRVLVTNIDNNESVIVTINDRGPFVKNRIIDLTKSAALKIHFKGTQKVRLQII